MSSAMITSSPSTLVRRSRGRAGVVLVLKFRLHSERAAGALRLLLVLLAVPVSDRLPLPPLPLVVLLLDVCPLMWYCLGFC